MYALHRAVDSFSNFSKAPTFEEERNLDNEILSNSILNVIIKQILR